jgi:hypothetical protein
MSVHQPKYSKEEAARRGDELYEQVVRPNIKPKDHGKYVAIDMDTGEWEMDEDEIAAGDRLLARLPDAQIWLTRVGYGYTVRFGGASLRRRS